MADTKISALPAATTPVAGTEVLPIVQSSTTKKLAISDLTPGLSTITVAKGGTNLSSYTAGDLLYASGTTTLAKLGIGTANYVLTSSGTAPQWSSSISTGVLTIGTKINVSGNGSTPSNSELGIGTNGVGSRWVYNAPTGGEHDFTINGANILIGSASGVGPGADNTETCGYSFWRWSVVYAATGTINTSDARAKQQVQNLTAAEQSVAKRIKGLIKTFKFNDAVEIKGNEARIHVGVLAQDVKNAFEAEGLDPFKYAMFCYDSWDDKFEDIYEDAEMVDENGVSHVVSVNTGSKKLVLAAGDRFGIRYDELIAFVISAL